MSDLPQSPPKAWKLTPLTPEYRESDHGVYVSSITEALSNPAIRNIALSGNYGVGKSSILQEIARQNEKRVVELSLSSLSPIETASLDGSVPKHAATTTNRIQQEIVKQLLYREEPQKTPGSRFQRIERSSFWREVGIGCLTGVAIAIIFFLTGWTGKIAEELFLIADIGLWLHLFIAGVAGVMIAAMRNLFQGRIHIGQLSAGSATVTLDKKSVSYFDQYLDEIVYFFEVSGRDILIFEDIDRFDDAFIFETLRSLNALLNNSPQIEKPIRFVYAIKDSIFDQASLKKNGRGFKQDIAIDDPAQAEVIRANRTKFFDLVIPVVPFITHRSARNLALQLLEEIDHQVDSDLIDLAVRYIPDMRLLKNIRNEFIVFRDRIFSGDGAQLKLSETELFAMMLYKSTHLADFEAIRLGKSKIDQLYDISRKLVIRNVQNTEKNVRIVRQKIIRIDGLAQESSMLGIKLIEHVKRVAQAAGYELQNGKFQFKGNDYTENDLKHLDFWQAFSKEKSEVTLRWRSSYHYQQQTLNFSRSDLALSLNTRLEQEYWDNTHRNTQKEELEKLLQNLTSLRIADMHSLMQRSDFTIPYDENNVELSLDTIARKLLTDGLAYELIRAGHINKNFTLYTSTFHGNRVSPGATNFIIHHVERNIMDEYFALNDADVASIMRECGKGILKETALYNIAILDYVLRKDTTSAEAIISSLIMFRKDENRFLQAYLSGGSECSKFIEYFAKATPRALLYLGTEVELDDSIRQTLINDSLRNLNDQITYQSDASLSAYLKDKYSEFPVLTSESVTELTANRIASLFVEKGIQITLLEPLSQTVRKAFISLNAYEINLDNLYTVLGRDASLALDSVYAENEGMYRYLIENLDEYIAATNDVSKTVESESFFVSAIEDAIASDSNQISELIRRASEACIIKSLQDVSEDVWPLLAQHNRFPTTFKNVRDYINAVGSIDKNLGNLLTSSGNITEYEIIEKEDKEELAKEILTSRDALPSPRIRVSLIASLKLKHYLKAEEIPVENGELYPLMIERIVIKDDASSYARLSEANWESREHVIEISKEFSNYITPSLLENDLVNFLTSQKIKLAVKQAIVQRADEFFEEANKTELATLAIFAIQNKIHLSSKMVGKLAANGVSEKAIVVLLTPHLQSLLPEELFEILRHLHEPYPKLTEFGSDHPKIPDNQENKALLDTLKKHGIVSSYGIDKDMLRVHKKHG